MIDTPPYAVNPKGWNRATSFEEGDGIPIERGSGFGGYLEREAIKQSIVKEYIEVSGATTVDVTNRIADLYIRCSAAGTPTITIVGTLPAGNTLYVDPRSYPCNVLIGGVTYALTGTRGVVAFYCTSAGWQAPDVYARDLRAINDVSVGRDVAIARNLGVYASASIAGVLTVGGLFTPGTDWTTVTVVVPNGGVAVLPRGALMVQHRGASSYLDILQVYQSGIWNGVMSGFLTSGGGPSVLRSFVFSTGGNYRYYNTSGATATMFYCY